LTAQTSSSYNAVTFRSQGIFFRQEYSNASIPRDQNIAALYDDEVCAVKNGQLFSLTNSFP